MKILQINNVYGQDSTGKITKDLHEGILASGHESIVIYGRGKTVHEGNVYRLTSNFYARLNALRSFVTGLPYGGCILSTQYLKHLIRKEKPDVVHLQCINGTFLNIYSLVQWLKQREIKTVVSLHAEFMYTANCSHAMECDQWKTGCKHCPNKRKMVRSWFFDRTAISWKKMQSAFKGFEQNCVIAPVSDWTENRARQSKILENFPFQTVYNGIDTERFFHLRNSGTEKGRPVLLHVTAFFSDQADHPKGGWYLIELAKRLPNVDFYVVGHHQSGIVCPENVHLMGYISDQEKLAELYSAADLTLLLSDRETFSMPCAESLCCGTPVVGFQAGAPEQISIKEYSQFVEYGNLDALESAVNSWLALKEIDSAQVSQAAKNKYSKENMINSFLDLYRRLLCSD